MSYLLSKNMRSYAAIPHILEAGGTNSSISDWIIIYFASNCFDH